MEKQVNVDGKSFKKSLKSGKSIVENRIEDDSAISKLFLEIALESIKSVGEFINRDKVFRSRFEKYEFNVA